MLKQETRDELDAFNKVLKEKFNDFNQKMIGETLIGGQTGYLGVYATCAIETEETGHNETGHTRKIETESVINAMRYSLSKLGDGMLSYTDQYYGHDEDHHWGEFIKAYLANRNKIAGFFAEEIIINESSSNENKFKVAKDSFEKLYQEALRSSLSICEVIINTDHSKKGKFEILKAEIESILPKGILSPSGITAPLSKEKEHENSKDS